MSIKILFFASVTIGLCIQSMSLTFAHVCNKNYHRHYGGNPVCLNLTADEIIEYDQLARQIYPLTNSDGCGGAAACNGMEALLQAVMNHNQIGFSSPISEPNLLDSPEGLPLTPEELSFATRITASEERQAVATSQQNQFVDAAAPVLSAAAPNLEGFDGAEVEIKGTKFNVAELEKLMNGQRLQVE